MEKKQIIIDLGSRILSEANDLKRTISALSKDIDVDEDFVKKVVEGNCEIEESYGIIRKMGDVYSIDISDLFLLEEDCTGGVKIMKARASIDSSRIFNRINKDSLKTPYYEYRDTAMSRLSPFKPEWIKELRVVDNDNPNNPDVAYNNGHFMHQTTFFVGPVNFYWEVNGKKYCREMNTGDSNYITPYWPHSFTSRDPNKEAYILAITFGGDVRRAQKEFYALGAKAKNFILDYRNSSKAVHQLIQQHMMNENITYDQLNERLMKVFTVTTDTVVLG